MPTILVTGVAGSGKTTIVETLRQMGFEAFDLESTADVFFLVAGKRRVKEDGLYSFIQSKRGPAAVFFTGIFHDIAEYVPYFDRVVLLVADEATTRARLSARTYPENTYGKSREMQDHIMTWKAGWERWLQVRYPHLRVVDANQSRLDTALAVLRAAHE